MMIFINIKVKVLEIVKNYCYNSNNKPEWDDIDE